MYCTVLVSYKCDLYLRLIKTGVKLKPYCITFGLIDFYIVA